MKVVCIKDTVTRHDSTGNPYELRDPFLAIGRTYTCISEGDDVIVFENADGDKWLSYERGIFVTQDEWRDRRLNDLGL